jgi:hypothetical protein
MPTLSITRKTPLARPGQALLAGVAVLLAAVAIAPVASAAGWELVPTPNAPGWPQSALSGVSCPYRTSCVAVGQGGLADGTAGNAISEGWNGAGWNVVFGPTFTSNTDFASVLCVSSTACEAVGFY